MGSAFRPALESALRSALAHLEGLDDSPVSATVSLAELRARLRKELNVESIPSWQVVEELVRDTKGGHLGSAGGRFFAWAIGGSTPAALAADWLQIAAPHARARFDVVTLDGGRAKLHRGAFG